MRAQFTKQLGLKRGVEKVLRIPIGRSSSSSLPGVGRLEGKAFKGLDLERMIRVRTLGGCREKHSRQRRKRDQKDQG